MKIPNISSYMRYSKSYTALTNKKPHIIKRSGAFLSGLNKDTVSFRKKPSGPDLSLMSEKELYVQHLKSEFEKLIKDDSAQKSPLFQKVNTGFFAKLNDHLINNPDKPFLISISGESASGKTTVCNIIKQKAQQQNLPVEIFSADNYFKDISKLIKQHGSFDKLLASGYDVDSPNNFDLEQLYSDLSELSDGHDVKIPKYLINGTGVVVPKAIDKKSQSVIIVEGMATMYGKAADLFDLKLYIDIKPEIQEKWYIERAQASRNQSEENAKKALKYVREASKKYILPKKDDSDIILNGGCPPDYINEVVEKISNIAISCRDPN